MKFKKILVLLIIVISSVNLFSQNLPTEVKSAIEGKDDGAKIDLLVDYGKSYSKKSDYTNSANCYKAAGVIYSSVGQQDGEAYCYNKAGQSYVKAKKYNDALKSYNKAKSGYTALKNNKKIYNVTFNIGDVYAYQKNYSKAISSYKAAYKLIKSNGDKKAQAILLNQIGTTYSNWGKKKDAYNYFEQALAKAKEANLNDLASNIQANLETATWNKATKEEKSQIQKEKEEEQKQVVENLNEDIEIKKQEHLVSLQEIDNLSFEMQAKELKLHVIQEKYEKQVLETKLKDQDIKLLEAEDELNKAEIENKNIELANQRKVLIIIGFSLGIISASLIYIFALYRQKRKNLILVKKQKEEIDIQNVTLNQANEEIAAQRDELETQRDVLNKQNSEITSSIHYAEKIQNSILPSNERISKYIKDFFILFKPKDIVSGDFYWFYRKGEDYWAAVVDCTGHGIPGAFMSMIGNSLLNKIILEDDIINPSQFLEKLNQEIRYALNQNKSDDTSDDGMDMTIVKMNLKEEKMTMALANHNAIVIKNNETEIIEGDIHSIGGLFSDMPGISFKDHIIDISKGTSVYMFSDGYQDQFGGDDNKKYTPERFKNKIIEIQAKSLDEQKTILEDTVDEWTGSNNQIDDILVVGVRF